MSEKTLPRPRQVTLAGWMVIIGSVLVVLFAADMISRLHSLETRESVEKLLADSPTIGDRFTVSGVLSIMRVVGMIAAGCATAAVILGWSVLQCNRSARLGLTVLAVPLLLAGLVTGGFTASVVAAAALMLWLQPARDWFDGKAAVPREAQRPDAGRPDPFAAPPTSSVSSTLPSAQQGPRAMVGYGDTAQVAPSLPSGAVPVAPGPFGAAPASRASRPTSVVWACALTWLFSLLGCVVAVIATVVIALNPQAVLDEVYKQNPEFAEAGFTDAMVLTATFVTAAGLVIWALGAIVLAFLVWRGIGWARIVLMVSSGGAIALLGLAVFTQPLMLLPLVAAGITMAMLGRPETAAWVARRSPRG